MSAYISGAVWRSGPQDVSRRYVLLAIADCANDEGFCWPSIQAIVEKTLLCKRTVISCIDDLVTEGWISISDHVKDARRNAYQVDLSKLVFDRPRQSKTIGANDAPKLGAFTAPIPEELGATVSKLGATDDIAIRKESSETSLKPSVAVAPVSLHGQVRSEIQLQFENLNKIKCPWDGSEARALDRMLKANPSWTQAQWFSMIQNYYSSLGSNGERPRSWIPRISTWAAGPLDRFGKVILKSQSGKKIQVRDLEGNILAERDL